MSPRRFDRIAIKLDWATVEVGDMERFCRACDFDPFGDTSQHRRFFDRQMALDLPFLFLGTRRPQFERLCIRWQAREALSQSAAGR